MTMAKRWRAFMARDRADRLLLCEAAVELGLARIAVATLPFRVIARRLSKTPDAGRHDAGLAARVGRAVTAAAAHVPWRAVCLPQAIAARRMLARRGCGSSLHFGIGADPAGLSAHAWLSAGNMIVVGADAIGGVTPVTRFD